MKAAQQFNDLTFDTIRAALSYIDNVNRDTWVEMAMAIKSELGETGFSIWNDWSADAANYNADDAKQVWKSVKAGGRITIGTLIHAAQQQGFELEKSETKRLTAEEVQDRKKQRDEEIRLEAEQTRMRHEAVAAEALKIWNAAAPAENHPYLKRKNVKAHGLRIGEWPTASTELLVPAYDVNGTLTTLQAIFANANPTIGSDKSFLAGGKKSGSFHTIGTPPPGGNGIVILCEGYATGATIHETTGHFVVVAFDRTNLKHVAQAIRQRYPAATILVAADNDQFTDGNPGVTAAKEILTAMPSRALLVVPEFSNLESKPTDFNDLAKLEGADAVARQINAAIPKVEPDQKNAPKVPLDAMVPVFGFVHVSDKGQPLNTAENLAYMLDEYGIKTKYNIVRKAVEVEIPSKNYSTDSKANLILSELNSLCARNRVPVSTLESYVKLLADRNAYNPVCDWIESKPWDGITRLPDLFKTVGVAGSSDLRDKLILRWLVSAVAAIYMDHGFEAHGCLVFTGKQGQGKTKWIKRLVPQALADVILVGAVMDPNNKDNVTNAVSHWIVELGELDATFRKADIARLKAWITNSVDKIRRPYDRVESEYQRRTVCFASVNETNYLVDDTGNRRWWTVPVTSLDYNHTIDMQQLWAEVLELFKRGEQHWLTNEEREALDVINNEHEAIDPIEEMIAQAFDWEGKFTSGNQEMTATDVLLAIGYDKPNKSQQHSASRALKKLTGSDAKKRSLGRFFTVPNKVPKTDKWADNDRPF